MFSIARALLWLLVAFATPASAAPVAARISLEDGPRALVFERTGLRRGELAEVMLSDPGTGRGSSGWVGAGTLVTIAPGVDESALAVALGIRLERVVMPSLGLWLVSDLDGSDGLTLAARLQRSDAWRRELTAAFPDVQLPHRLATIAVPPNDPRYPEQWFLSRLGIEDAWRIESGKPHVSVVVSDSGCDLGHPDLKDQLDPGLDVLDGDDDPSPTDGDAHGTACAGLVGASTDNGEGVAGVCPGCRMRCVRLISPDTLVKLSADIAAFQFVLDSGAAVSSNSWGFRDAIPVPNLLRAAIEAVHDQGRGGKGAVVVFAAGNHGRPLGDDELTAVRGVITVGAVNELGEIADYSNYGPSIDLVAPAGNLTTDIRGAPGDDPGDYTTGFGGTSAACPLVAGVAGLLLSRAPDKTADEIEAVLVATANQSTSATPDRNGHDLFYGFGQIAPAAALEQVAASGCGCHVAQARSDGASGALLPFAAFAIFAVRRARRR